MTQTVAIFYDAYRSLNAKWMFWIVLILSALVAVCFALVSINESGLKIAFWQVENELLNTQHITPAFLYKWMFVNLGIGVWLAWIATVLALISTAGIFPDLTADGSIELLVSKPISRLRLFVTQYAAGLLFVTLQVTLFSLGSFLVIGLRGGVWEPGLFVAVPLLVCFFSYLFSVCVFFGLTTRSTLAALLLTLLVWFGIYAVGATENFLLMYRTMDEQGVAWADMQTPPKPPDDQAADARPKEAEPSAEPPANASSRQDNEKGKKEESRSLVLAHKIAYGVKTVLPKTTETMGLLERSLIDLAELPDQGAGRAEKQALVGRKVQETLRSRSVAWVVGTSLGFELVVLAGAALVFCRRDY